MIVEQESGRVGREDGRIDDEQQNQPVPDCLEGTIVEDRPLVDAGRLELVLGKDVCTQGQDLGEWKER